MSREDAILVEGIVAEAFPNETFRVVLSNGHKVLAHFSRKRKVATKEIAVGDTVNLEMSPFDLSKGRIVLEK